MGRAAAIALGAVLGGLLLALALVDAAQPPAPRASAPSISGADAPPSDGAAIDRCRTATVADAECAAAWEARRRHFFRQAKDER